MADVNVQVLLSTSADDLDDAVAVQYGRDLTQYFMDPSFKAALEVRAVDWLPVHLALSSTDSTDVDEGVLSSAANCA
ncbi:hypothetical protein ACFSW8_04270 [Rubritalea tangerina]|uniref:Uncharacterized protein n=2 Tax=Rubritalea tangerina TaxID=430798 RepID=A0ABW4Z858_9BACT